MKKFSRAQPLTSNIPSAGAPAGAMAGAPMATPVAPPSSPVQAPGPSPVLAVFPGAMAPQASAPVPMAPQAPQASAPVPMAPQAPQASAPVPMVPQAPQASAPAPMAPQAPLASAPAQAPQASAPVPAPMAPLASVPVPMSPLANGPLVRPAGVEEVAAQDPGRIRGFLGAGRPAAAQMAANYEHCARGWQGYASALEEVCRAQQGRIAELEASEHALAAANAQWAAQHRTVAAQAVLEVASAGFPASEPLPAATHGSGLVEQLQVEIDAARAALAKEPDPERRYALQGRIDALEAKQDAAEERGGVV